jgi:hypothetical protein
MLFFMRFRTQDVWGAEGISGRVKFLLLAWAGMPKTSFRKNSDSPLLCEVEADAGRTGAYPIRSVWDYQPSRSLSMAGSDCAVLAYNTVRWMAQLSGNKTLCEWESFCCLLGLGCQKQAFAKK